MAWLSCLKTACWRGRNSNLIPKTDKRSVMFKRSLFFVILFALALTACSTGADSGANQAAPVQIKLPMGYIPNVQYAPFYVAVEKGYFAAEGIQLEFDYSFETDGVALVGANKLPFALVSGEQVLLARAQGLPVVYVLGWYQKYPISVVAHQSENIRTPADLRGKKIGLPGLFGANYVGLRALLYTAGLKESDVTLDSIGFNQVEALATRQEQAVVGYTANEPIILRAQGVLIDEIRVADYVQLASNGILTNETVLKEQPDLVRAFNRAFLRGLQDTLANPQEAYEICKKFVENLAQADETVQKQVLAASIEMWKAPRLGYSDPAAWQTMQTVLLEMGMYPAPIDVSQAFSNDYLP
ncbi:MAG: myristoyl transferase [Anaerolineae bacterium]|nr:MAG: myristoyl transferase [Anaerolineae bacterium]